MSHDAAWVAEQEAALERLEATGMYAAQDERDACGVGFVVAIDGVPRRSVVENGIKALSAIWHRGAVDADGKTGDGAGIHVQIPTAFFEEQVRHTGHVPRGEKLAVGQIFLPRNDFGAQEAARTIVEAEVLRLGYYIYGWRHVPVDISCLGDKANATRPEIEQILISNAKGVDEETFERELYVIRRRIEKAGGGDPRFLHLLDVVPVDHLQGHDAGRGGQRLLSRPHGRAVRERLRDLSPALFDQHLPALVAGPAVPDARAQRRDQHAQGQPQLDAEPRDPHGVELFRRAGRGHQADRPAERFRQRGARQRVRGAGARRAHGADGEDRCSCPRPGPRRRRTCPRRGSRCTPIRTR